MMTNCIQELSALTGQSVTVEFNPHLSQGISLLRYLNQERFVGPGMSRAPVTLDNILESGTIVKVTTQLNNTMTIAIHGPDIEYCVDKITELVNTFNEGVFYDPS